MSRSNLIDATVIVRHETARAWLVDHGGKEPVWIAKSQAEIHPNADGKTATITLEQWLAEEKEIV